MTNDWDGLYRYDAWANDMTLSSIRDQGDAGDEARKLFSHILAAQMTWLGRLTQESPTVQVWPSMTLEQMTRHTSELPTKWTSFISDAEDELDQPCEYRNTKGERFRTPVTEILMHVLMHSAYHRGQIAMELRSVGLVPATTDYIAYTRR